MGSKTLNTHASSSDRADRREPKGTSRILIWSPNYAPEPTGIPPLVTDAAEWLVTQGHSVEVVTAVPNYPERRIHAGYERVLSRTETRNGVCVRRSWLRARSERSFVDKALYELSISTFALPNAIRAARHADVIVCVIPTLVAARYAATLATVLNKRLVLWVQDLVVSAAQSVSNGQAAGWGLTAGLWLERSAARSADKIVVCSPGFGEHLAHQGVDLAKIETIHNWADLTGFDRLRPTGIGVLLDFSMRGTSATPRVSKR